MGSESFSMPSYEERDYRSLVANDRLESFRAVVKETDLLIRAEKAFIKETQDLILKHRLPLERYAADHPDFVQSLTPISFDKFAPPIVQAMLLAGQNAGVGPMASVAGALAEQVGKDLMEYSERLLLKTEEISLFGRIFHLTSRFLQVLLR